MGKKKLEIKDMRKRHYFYLNPYEEFAFTKCPKCDNKTKVRKFPLVIHIDPDQMFLLNKQCKYCINCDLIITKKTDVENLMAVRMSQACPEIIGNDYLVMGTVDRKDWLEGKENKIITTDIIDRMYIFKDVLKFEFVGGWYREDK
ncbi:MAG: hypothetical protein SVY10_07010 [Thermodesulfobacteriota bacterium]|nr:hypothetical protein [Thermodesulfobacteriota bacterium]